MQLEVANTRVVIFVQRWTVGVLVAAARVIRLRVKSVALIKPRGVMASPRVRLVVGVHGLLAAAFVVAGVVRWSDEGRAWIVLGGVYAVVALLLTRGTRLIYWAAIAMAAMATMGALWFVWGAGIGTKGAAYAWIFISLGPLPLALLSFASSRYWSTVTCLTESITMSVHAMLEEGYEGGVDELKRRLDEGVDLEERLGPLQETPLMIATRRRRLDAVELLVERGAEIDAANAHGKTSYVHAVRRTFDEIAEALATRGADTTLAPADRLAVHLTDGELDAARAMLADDPSLARTGNPEEDRILADLAGRFDTEPVALLIEAGANLSAPALDGASALHQAAWFGQPDNARQLIAAGAPLDIRCTDHRLTPLGWACHGSKYSGGADERSDVYVEIARMILEAGGAPDGKTVDASKETDMLFAMSTPEVHAVLRDAGLTPST